MYSIKQELQNIFFLFYQIFTPMNIQIGVPVNSFNGNVTFEFERHNVPF